MRCSCVPGASFLLDLQLAQERFCNEWMSVDDTMAAAVDVKIRDAGWHFIWAAHSADDAKHA
jgi:hypothetical protein